ncbi:hypothetical protein ABIE44_003537 [Marmoricola sp. OAE513]|uniref:DUF4349 domain-containing protein n=1 Tax=Marmoricola sp. OAE513 TaxID=2817894 RepID=UPI001AE1DDA9
MKISRVALAVPVLALVAACGAAAHDAGDSKAASADADSSQVDPASAPGAEPAPGARDASGGTSAEGFAYSDAKVAKSDSVPQERAIISTGQVSLRTKDLDQARFDLQKLLDSLGGIIADEESSADEKGRTDRQRLELRVPSTKFGTAMDRISKLGVLVDRSRSSGDVTAQVIDNNARLRSQKLSLARIQALLAKAKDLDQVIAIEGQLSQRQADLEALESQQKYLSDSTALATINVYLRLPDDETATPKKDDDNDGFLGGLDSGWDALATVTSVVLVSVGALLPFAAVLAAIGVPVWISRRRRTAQVG